MRLLTSTTQLDLQKTDIWSFGLLAYSLVNQNLANQPSSRKESENLGHRFDMETMKQFMQSQQLPSHDEKSFRVTLCWQIDDVFSMCAKFDPKCRPATPEVLRRIENPDASLIMKQLSVSQSTALKDSE